MKMKKQKLWCWSDNLIHLRGDEFIEALNTFAEINNVELSSIDFSVEGDEYSSSIRASCYREETDEEFNRRKKTYEASKKQVEELERKQYEELKKRFG